MTSSRRSLQILIAAAGLAIVAAPARAQEFGAYVGGGVGGIRDVRRPFGGGVTGTLLFHDWIGIRGDAGYYWTREHRATLVCETGVAEPHCSAVNLSSHSHFPLLGALAVVRGRIPHRGLLFEVGAGPAWVNVTNEIRTDKDSIYSPRLTSSRVGMVVMTGLAAHPDWSIPLTFEGSYVYHMTAAFGACTNQPNDPVCGQHLNFHELRFTALFSPRYRHH